MWPSSRWVESGPDAAAESDTTTGEPSGDEDELDPEGSYYLDH
jgi:hypothetical protein